MSTAGQGQASELAEKALLLFIEVSCCKFDQLMSSFSFVKALPVIFISGVIGWSYYAYMGVVVLVCMVPSPTEQVSHSRRALLSPCAGVVCRSLPPPDGSVCLVVRHGGADPPWRGAPVVETLQGGGGQAGGGGLGGGVEEYPQLCG